MSGKAKKPVDPIEQRVEELVSRPKYFLDKEPAVNGKNQNEWIDYFNAEDIIMASAPDIYNAAKTADDDVLESLRTDFKDYWFISSTRINYNKRNLKAKVTHYFGSEHTKPMVKKKIHIPHYSRTPLETVLAGPQGLNYVQILFDTEDGKDDIIQTLGDLSNKPSDQIYFWTPDQNSRKDAPERSVGFDYGDGDFHVGGYHPDGGNGVSRGVKAA